MANQYSKYTLKSIRAACKEFEEQNSFDGLYIHGHYKHQSLTNQQLIDLIILTTTQLDLIDKATSEWTYTTIEPPNDLFSVLKRHVIEIDKIGYNKLEEMLSNFSVGASLTYTYTEEKGNSKNEVFWKENGGTWKSVYYLDESKAQRRKPHYDDRRDIAELMGVEYTEEFDMKFQEVLDRFY
jgi:hypothetical protein